MDAHAVTPVRDRGSGLVVAVAADRAMLPAFWVGQPVGVRIDLVARTAHAALHTAGHLIEAAGREQGWVPAANSHFPGQARIGFTAPVPDARLDTPEGREEVTEALRAAVARAVVWDLPVTWGNDSEGRRIVRLSGLHSALCGGTHVRSLGDLAGVVLRDLKVRKGRIRVSCSAAHRERS
ncbi:metal-dependent hydrolase [Streptomyces sp. NPDC005827]|uniref:metal-dependent hydrolase n=1 Tax=Streptomyces sp. NPDC005827 TaxID=3157070 RepID=UPI0033EEAB4E